MYCSYFLLKMGMSFQPVMLVYQRVTFMESTGFPSVFDRRHAMLNDRSQSPSHVRRTNGPRFDPRVEVRHGAGIARGGNWTNWIAKRRCYICLVERFCASTWFFFKVYFLFGVILLIFLGCTRYFARVLMADLSARWFGNGGKNSQSAIASSFWRLMKYTKNHHKITIKSPRLQKFVRKWWKWHM